MSELSFKKQDTYVYQLTQPVLDSLQVLYFDDHLNVCPAPTKPIENDTIKITKNNIFHCNACNIDLENADKQREHYQNELHTVNLRRKFHQLPPFKSMDEVTKSAESLAEKGVEEEEDDKMDAIAEDANDTSGSDETEENETEDDIYAKNTATLDAQFKYLQPFDDNDTRISHLANQTPYILFKSNLLTKDRTAFGAYKTLFNNNQLENPLKTLSDWNKDMESVSHKFSAIFMIGGGHFAGAIISHQRLNISGNLRKQDISPQEQATMFLEHKTFHRYTTRRKQGGSQSAMDNAKGKANSAGSSIRRYNEAALKVDVQTLLKDWKPYLDNCENIFIRARAAYDRRTFFEEGFFIKNDPRIKSLPFTTGRPTVGELKKAWCEMVYLKISNLPKPLLEKGKNIEKKTKKKSESPQIEKPLTLEEKQTEDIVQLLKKGRAPLLISYLRKNKIDKDFTLAPEVKYNGTPTMLHYCSQNGLKQMVLILLTNLKCSPVIKNNSGKTAWDLAKTLPVKQSFQIARHNLGESFTSWEDSHVAEPLSREDVEQMNQEIEKNEKKEAQDIVKKELQNVKERQKEDYEKKNGKGNTLSVSVASPAISMEQNLNSLTDDQKRRLMREQRARAAEARLRQSQ
ncbi:hypothetical protein C6P45_002254 [Maudiozyma exigua]|uniref:VLRF1 domain-containing protein n=1 Tax=Maudiozyma exigua TaxID=34358 RepID=A0A9P6WD06_MAUEX|nr:hypothetical protein C6P45_002254 [Kazachstania exigua]